MSCNHSDIKSLSELAKGTRAVVNRISDTINEDLQQRLQELGFLPGTELHLLFKTPFGGPMAFRIRGTIIALRRNEAQAIKVKPCYN